MSNNLLPEVDLSRCDGCAGCVKACPQNALAVANGKVTFAQPDACVFCTSCEEICPRGAIRCAFEIVWSDEPNQ